MDVGEYYKNWSETCIELFKLLKINLKTFEPKVDNKVDYQF